MSDQYQSFANSPLGKLVVKNLGLPAPLSLKRAKAGQADVQGSILWGTAPNSPLTDATAQIFKALAVEIHASKNDQLKQSAERAGLNLKHFYTGDEQSKFHALVFDASGIDDAAGLKAVYEFFHPVARQVQASGRVVILASTPSSAESVAKAMAQRALEGFVKSLGKELKKGITAQLVYVDQGAEQNLESTLRFVLSPRSAYVSGQVIHVAKADVVADIDWAKPLQGKTAVVTGASRGIGEAIAETLARDGAKVICLDVPQQQADLESVASKIGGTTLALDITASDAGEKIKQMADLHGGLDILVHNAGVTRDKTLARMTAEQWDLVMNINLISNAQVNDYLLENQGFNQNARIVCVSSISGIAGNLGQSNYAMSKAGVIGLVKFTAPTLSNGITINAVAPGFIETKMTAAIPFAIREAGRRMNSMSQGGLPVDVAETIAYFASPASTGLNGNVVRVCGQSLLGA